MLRCIYTEMQRCGQKICIYALGYPVVGPSEVNVYMQDKRSASLDFAYIRRERLGYVSISRS